MSKRATLFLLTVLGLMGLGVLVVYSASWAVAQEQFQDGMYYLKRQSIFAAIAVIALVIGATLSPTRYARWNYALLAGTFFLLIIVLIPGIGMAAGIARRWIALGPIALQAGEVAKFSVVVYLAISMARKGERMRTFSIGVMPHLLVVGSIVVLLLMEPDFGTAMMLTAVAGIMLFVGGVRWRYLLGGVLAVIPLAVFLISTSAYRMRRIVAFLDPWTHRFDEGYQITESLMTIGSGQLFGLGLGEGRQKLFFLPAGHTDFILAGIGEELGFVGVLFVLISFLIILLLGMGAALRFQDPYRGHLAAGLTSVIITQAAFNFAVVLGMVPTKGLTLPFLSYGGSSLVCTAFIAGVLLRLIMESEREEAL